MAFSHHTSFLDTIIRLLNNMCFALSWNIHVDLILGVLVVRTSESWVFNGLVPEKLISVDVIRVLKRIVLCLRVLLYILVVI